MILSVDFWFITFDDDVRS